MKYRAYCSVLFLLGLTTGFATNSPAWSEDITTTQESLVQEKAQELACAVGKFKQLGVGVKPFEERLSTINLLIGESRYEQADALLKSLELSLKDQQKRFYANKLQVWQQTRQNLIANAKKVNPQATQHAKQSFPSASSGLGKAAHGVLSRDKGGYTPLIYPIAR